MLYPAHRILAPRLQWATHTALDARSPYIRRVQNTCRTINTADTSKSGGTRGCTGQGHARMSAQSSWCYAPHKNQAHEKHGRSQTTKTPASWSLAPEACSRPEHPYIAPLPLHAARVVDHTWPCPGLPILTNHVDTLTPPPARPRWPPPLRPCRPSPPPKPRLPLAPPPRAAAPSPRCP